MVNMWTQRRVTAEGGGSLERAQFTPEQAVICVCLSVFICVQPWGQGRGFSEMERLTSVSLEGARILWESKTSRCRTGKKLVRRPGQ